MFGSKLMWIVCLAGLVWRPAVSRTPEDPVSLDARTRSKVIAAIDELLIDQYIFLDVAERMRDHLNTRLADGAYDQLEDPAAFCAVVRQNLHDISKDNHFFLEYNPERAARIQAEAAGMQEEAERAKSEFREQDRVINFGFRKLEILPGNVGYLDLQLFADPANGGDTAVAAMAFLANSDAVIIDLRDCPGGDPTMVQLLCSYFVKPGEDGRIHLNSFERRYNQSLEQFWTFSYVPGKTMYETDLYVLISNNTGSGAEEFSYDMKNLKRATLMGETTRGSAHPIDAKVLCENFVLHLPTGRPVNPVSGTNWERTGVAPDVKVDQDRALGAAYLAALEKLSQAQLSPPQKIQVTWALDAARAKLHPVDIPAEVLKSFAGTFGERKVRFEDGGLVYQRTGAPRRLIALTPTIFAIEGLERFRVEFVRDDAGHVTAIRGQYDDGTHDISTRTE